MQPGGDVEQGRFAAAGRADDGDELAVGNRERGALDRRVGAAVGEPEGHGHLRERDGGRHDGPAADSACSLSRPNSGLPEFDT